MFICVFTKWYLITRISELVPVVCDTFNLVQPGRQTQAVIYVTVSQSFIKVNDKNYLHPKNQYISSKFWNSTPINLNV